MQLQPDTSRTIGMEAAKAAATSVAAVLSLSLDSWLKVLTICAIVVSTAYTLWKWHRDWRRAKLRDASES